MEILKFFWQLPQILVAFIYYNYLKYRNDIIDTCTFKGTVVFIKRSSKSSVTLGDCIFLSPYATDNTINHEWGHTRQSILLGPLYLLVIGLPSILWAAIHKYIVPSMYYYSFYTEAWANKLSGIK